jgi:hypothetical protein
MIASSNSYTSFRYSHIVQLREIGMVVRLTIYVSNIFLIGIMFGSYIYVWFLSRVVFIFPLALNRHKISIIFILIGRNWVATIAITYYCLMQNKEWHGV